MLVEQVETRSKMIARLLKEGQGRYTLGQQQTLAEIGFECQRLELEGLT